jgi:hypothetical protein
MRFWATLFGLIALFVVLSACGGGGGGSKALITPPVGTDQNSGNNPLPPAFESVDVEVPLEAEEAGEIGGVVADYLGNTVPDLEVYLNSPDNLVSSTDEDGKFVVAGVVAGEHELMIGIEGTVVASYTLNYDDTTPMNLALSPSGLRTVSEFERFGALAGRVTNEQENPVPGVRVLIFNGQGFFLVKRTNENGVYEFPRVPVGEYHLLGYKRGYRTHVGQVAINADELTHYDFVMRGFPVGRVVGTVGDEEGRALPRVHVFLLYREGDGDRPPLSFHAMTNEHGEYAFYEVPAGLADMLAFKPGYEPEDAVVTVPPQGQVVQNFVLHQTGPPPPPPPPDVASLSGHVFGGEDHPLGGALVELFRGDDLYFSATTGDEGVYHFEEIPVGHYVFEVSAEGYGAIRGELVLQPGQNHRDFYLPPNPPPFGSIEGTVFWGESEERVVGARVELWVPGEGGELHKIRETQTNENGRFCFGEVPPGPGLVKAFKEDHAGAAEYFLEPGQNIEVTLGIFPSQEWSGKIIGRTRIVDPEHPDQFINIPGVEVKLFYGPPGEDNPPLAVTYSGDGGLYQFLNLPPTEPDRQYVLVAHKQMEGQMWVGMEDTPLGENQVVELHITLHPEGPPPGAIFGFVFKGETDAKVPGAHALLFHGEPGEENPPIRDTWSTDGGAYHFGELPPSGDLPYVIVAEKEIEGQLWRGAADTHLEQGQEKRVDVHIFPAPPPNSVLFGKVLRPDPENPDHLIPVPGAVVKLWHGAPGGPPLRTAETGPEGWFEFGELLPSGEVPYTLFAERWIEEVHFAGWADGIWLPPGQEVRVDVVVHAEGPPPLADIRGFIFREDPENPDGHIPVPGAVVKLYHGDPEGQEPLRTIESNGEGHYAFEELEPSGDVPYFVVASKWIEEVFFTGLEDTHLGQDDVELNVWIWPED